MDKLKIYSIIPLTLIFVLKMLKMDSFFLILKTNELIFQNIIFLFQVHEMDVQKDVQKLGKLKVQMIKKHGI